MSSLDYIRKYRKMPWVKRGMRIAYGSESGRIVGGTDGGNLRVKLDERKHTCICHPQWHMTYYDKSGEVIAEYKG